MPLFFALRGPYTSVMTIFSGLGQRARGLLSDIKGPWGPPPTGDQEGPSGGDAPSGGPWTEPPKRRRGPALPTGNVTSLDEFLRRSRARFGGGGGFPGRPDRSIITWAIAAIVLVWLLFTTMPRIAPEERGVVTNFGR